MACLARLAPQVPATNFPKGFYKYATLTSVRYPGAASALRRTGRAIPVAVPGGRLGDKRLRCPPTAALRSPPCIRHRRRSGRLPCPYRVRFWVWAVWASAPTALRRTGGASPRPYRIRFLTVREIAIYKKRTCFTRPLFAFILSPGASAPGFPPPSLQYPQQSSCSPPHSSHTRSHTWWADSPASHYSNQNSAPLQRVRCPQ